MHKRGKIRWNVWKSGRRETLRQIEITSLGDGWTVGEATLDNVQFFNRRADAERAARSLGARLSDAGDPSEINVRLPDGKTGGRFLCAGRGIERGVTP